MIRASAARVGLFALLGVAWGCSGDEVSSPKTLSVEELMKPETCRECHQDHFREWSGSMHAYAAEDPVFLAMNARGQRETGGALGNFCINCHAPMAVRLGATSDGLNLDQLPAELKGVTCYFCHNTTSVDDSHNNPLGLAMDTTLRGGISDPMPNEAHGSAHSNLHDGDSAESSSLCGACHDIQVPSPPGAANIHLERTFLEWKETLFSADPADGGLSCGACHMNGRRGVAADVPGVPLRDVVHNHQFPGVDLALTPFPEREAQLESIRRELDITLRTEICVAQLVDGAVIEVTLENLAAGHRWPSGATHDRRAWVELRAFEGSNEKYQSGVIAEGEAVSASTDPDLWQLRDFALGVDGKEAHMFWDIASVTSTTIPGPVTFQRSDPAYFDTHVSRRYPGANGATPVIEGVLDRVSVRVRLRPMGLEVLDDVVASGDLTPEVRDAMPTHDLLPGREQSQVSLEWTELAAADPRLGSRRVISGVEAQCVTNAAQASR